jgi:glycerophosphoryl diester phosphodiesterase
MAHGSAVWTGIPGNTMPRFEKAAEDGYKFVEVDVCFTSDNVPVGSHDDDITAKVNKADGSVPDESVIISASTYEQLLAYDFGVRYGSDYAGIRIMKLEDLLYFCKRKNMCVLMDLKGTLTNDQMDIVYNMVIKSGMKSRSVWYADSARLPYLTGKDTGLIYDVPSHALALQYRDRAAMVIFDTSNTATLNKEFISTLHQTGVRCYGWTVNVQETAAELFANGCDYVCTDYLLNNSI